MKDRYFNMKFLNLVLIVLILAGYQTVLHTRTQEEKIAELEYQLEGAGAGTASDDGKGGNAGASYADGTYTGDADGFGGTIQVSVKIEDGTITSIDVTKADGEDSAYLETAMGVTDEIMEAQSADVDTVSGATFSSAGICNAVKAALEQAVAE